MLHLVCRHPTLRRFPLGTLALGVLLTTTACERSTRPPPTLAQLDAEDDAKVAGGWLMDTAYGLHRLDTRQDAPTGVAIGVHGYDSAGYEWVYPLKTTGETGVQVHFHRWDWDQCPQPMAEQLDASLDALLQAQPSLSHVQVIAHSYGGVVAALMAARYDGGVPLTVDVVASPLAGVPRMSRRCSYDGPEAPAEGVTLRQWRTRQDLDGVFRDMDEDPQVVDLPGEVTVLPETYRGKRLGHNWSISWVVDHLGGSAPP